MICTNQVEKFPVRFKSGNNYLMVLYDYNVNTTLATLIADRKSRILQRAFFSLFNQIK
jgi:hypothetical protein